MKQSNPKLTKINYIAQVSKNLVGQNGTKLTKVTGTQSNEMKQNEPKWSEVEQSGPKWWDPVIQNLTRDLVKFTEINRNGPMV